MARSAGGVDSLVLPYEGFRVNRVDLLENVVIETRVLEVSRHGVHWGPSIRRRFHQSLLIELEQRFHGVAQIRGGILQEVYPQASRAWVAFNTLLVNKIIFK